MSARGRRGRAFYAFLALAASAGNAPTVPATGERPEPVLELKETSVLPKDWGTTYSGTIRSQRLGAVRTVDIYVPPTFSKTRRKYPVLYLTDGEYNFERAVVAEMELARSGHIPESLVVAIETPERRQDLTPPGLSAMQSDGPDQRGEKFVHFIMDELRPQLEARFRAGAPSVLMGHSHGGILCAYVAAKWRKEIPFVVALDAPVHIDDGWLAKTLASSAAEPGNLRLVSLEVKFGWPDDLWSKLVAVAPKDWKLSRIKLADEDHESMVFGGFYRGLKELFSDYSQVQVKGLGGPAAFDHYLQLEPLYGGSVAPPRAVLEHAEMDLCALGTRDLARKALNAWAEDYGEPEDFQDRLSEIDEAAEALKGKETVEQLLALDPPTAVQIAPYLGVWKGHSWVDVDESRKSDITVTFSVENGRGVAKIVNEGAPPEFRSETCRYLRVTPAGIEFGNMNGMFPPGIVARIGRLEGATLAGEAVFKGVYFRWPKDLGRRPHHMFALERVTG
jgi:hypothetical protein